MNKEQFIVLAILLTLAECETKNKSMMYEEQAVDQAVMHVPPLYPKRLRKLPMPCLGIPSNNTASGLYNSKSEKCCLGSITTLSGLAHSPKCCGTNVYDSAKEACCNHTVVPVFPGYRCCGSKSYNPTFSICCNGVLTNIHANMSTFIKCCGRKTYDSRIQSCCAGEETVVDGSNPDISCCGDKMYNIATQVCCIRQERNLSSNLVLTKDGSKTQCCGTILFDPSIESCCRGVPFDRNTHGCCGGMRLYDSKTEICCYGETINVVMKSDLNQTDCCGSQPYNSANEICCHSNAVISKTKFEDYRCCGSVSYHPATHICCNAQVVNKSTFTDISCCGDSALYNVNTQLCCREYNSKINTIASAVVSKSLSVEEPVFCCGLKAYYPRTQHCCIGYENRTKVSKIVERIGSHGDRFDCCGSLGFNIKTQFCCRDRDTVTGLPVSSIINKSKVTRSNGSSSKGDLTHDVASGNMDVTVTYASCCGLKFFNDETELCCERTIFRKTPTARCCGSKLYDVTVQKCCNDGETFFVGKGKDECCTYGTTDENMCF